MSEATKCDPATVNVAQANGRPMLSLAKSTAVAVRITDMLGEEVLVVLPPAR